MRAKDHRSVHTGSEQSVRPLMLPREDPGCGASHDDVSTLLAPGQMLIGCTPRL